MKNLIIILILTLNIFAFTPDDIKAMKDFGILVSFNDTDKPSEISENLTPKEFLNITYLHFNNSPIYNLPEWITKLKKLKGLNLNGAKINLDELQKISSLTELTVLNLSNNDLFKGVNGAKELISILSNFELNELSLSNTGGTLCNYKDIGTLSYLIELNLSHNNLNNISDKNCTLKVLGLDKLSRLEVLDLSNSKINGDFYTQFLPINSLVVLNLAMNNIQKFKYYKPLPRLEKLDLSKNSNLKIAPNYGGLFAMKKLVYLKRESNVDVPKGLKNRLEQTKNYISKEENLKYKGILKKLGLEKTHGYLKKEFYNTGLQLIPKGSILFLKKDLILIRAETEMNNCQINYNYSYKNINFLTDNITIDSGTKFIINEIDRKFEGYYASVNFDESSLKGITCSIYGDNGYWHIDELKKQINDYFYIFIKK
jgi:hypothetical protein